MKKVLSSQFKENMSKHVTRRRVVVAGGVAAAGVSAIAVAAAVGGKGAQFGDLKNAEVTDIGDGFILVDGWVLKASDLPGAQKRKN